MAVELLCTCPLAGEVVHVAQCADPTFAQGLLGPGVVILPRGNLVAAPVDGTVEFVLSTRHALGLRSPTGVKCLIHVGLETVSLGGKHFKTCAKTGDHVTKGQLLIEFDREAIAAEGLDTITPMVICNTPDYQAVNAYYGKTVAAGDTVLGLVK